MGGSKLIKKSLSLASSNNMAFSVCSFSIFVPLTSIRNNKLRCNARGTSSMATQTPSKLVNCERRSANYPPTMWEDGYVQSLTVDFKEESIGNEIANLKEEVRQDMFGKAEKFVDELELIDNLQQLGVAYHFEEEIHDVLSTIHKTLHLVEKDDLYAMSLLFRLLREHGFHISQDAFNNFKDEEGRFRTSLCNDIKSILSLYEASFLAMKGEDQLDEDRDFAMKRLKEVNAQVFVDPSMKEKVSHALELPLHWRMQRLHTRWFIDQYERDEDMNPSLLKLAKLDFNMVQGIYKRELKEMSSWWTDLGVGKSLGFARERLVENYFWTVGYSFEPKFGRTREAIAKGNCLICTIDDVYDIYGTLEELELFTDAVERWDASATEQLPDYMKICFMALFNTTNDTAYKTLKLKGVDVLPCLKRAWADLCKAYLVEAKWYHERYMPTLKEYLDNAWISISGHVALTHAYCASEDVSKEALELYNFYPDVAHHSSLILRLCNDLGTSTAELERGDVPKAIQCYMNDNNVSEITARDKILEMIASTWKEVNNDRIANSSFEESFKKVALNIPRMSKCMYQYGDGHGRPGQEIKDRIISILIEPIQL